MNIVKSAGLFLCLLFFVSIQSVIAMESVLEQLPVVLDAEDESGLKCAICLNEIDSAEENAAIGKLVFGCSSDHAFHAECLDQWHNKQVAVKHVMTCPLCRKLACKERVILMQATDDGDFQKVLSFIERDVDIDEQDEYKRTILMRAVLANQLKIVTCLTNFNAQIDKCDNLGGTPLMWAVHKRYYAIVNHLLTHGADINARDESGHSVLMYSAIGDRDIIKYLLALGADINARDNTGATMFMFAAEWGNKRVINLLLRYGADIRICDSCGRTAAARARIKGHVELADYLDRLSFAE